MATAFPIVSEGTPPKSLFDFPEGEPICSMANYAIYPLNERKGKSKSGFLVAKPTLLEIHKSQKDFKAGKQAKYLIGLAGVFNVCIQVDPIQIKGDCITVMEPAETYFIKPFDSDFPLDAWLDWILEKARECRSNNLVRPVFKEEYFEASWDVEVIRKPKLRKEYNKSEQVEDLGSKRPSMIGRRRLCICPTSFLLFAMEAKPTNNVDVPFDKQSFVDLSLNVISNYGCQEKYFFIRIGRCSEIGSGELWMACESGASAKAMHERINAINLRESDRRREQGIKIAIPTISSRVLKSRAHRERSQTANQQLQKSDSHLRLRAMGHSQSANEEKDPKLRSKNASTNSMNSLLTPVSSNISLVALASGKQNCQDQLSQKSSSGVSGSAVNVSRMESELCSIPEKVREEMNVHAPPTKKNSIVGLLNFRSRAKLSTASSIASPAAGGPGDCPQSPCSVAGFSSHHSDGVVAPNRLSASARYPSRGGNGSHSKLDRSHMPPASVETTVDGPGASAVVTPYNCAEDYMSYDPRAENHLSNFVQVHADESSRKSSATFSGIIMHNNLPMRQFSMGTNSIAPSDSHQRMSSVSTSAAVAAMPIEVPKDYLEMDENTLSTLYRPEMVFPLQEVRSYISNSTESCWSPHSSEGLSNVPRAYSLGSKPTAAAKMIAQRQRELAESAQAGNTGISGAGYAKAASSSSVAPAGVHQLVACSFSPPRVRPTTTPIEQSMTDIHRLSLAPGSAGQPVQGHCAPNVSTVHSKSTICDPLTSCTTTAAIVTWRGGVHQAGARDLDDNAGDSSSDMITADIRMRAHSVGSKSWIKHPPGSLRKMSGKRNANVVNDLIGSDTSEARERADSTGSRASSIFSTGANFDGGGGHVRRNTNRSVMSSQLGDTHHQLQDHVEIDFDRDGSCASIESPANRSRNSSLGVQMPSSVRSALDLALSSQHHHITHRISSPLFEKPSDSFLQGKGQKVGEHEACVVRKRSVPEMSIVTEANNMSTDPAQGQGNTAYHQQRRRSTFDCTTAASASGMANAGRFRPKANTNHHLPPADRSKLAPVAAVNGKTINKEGRFGSTSLSTSSGISSRSSEPSISTLASGCSPSNTAIGLSSAVGSNLTLVQQPQAATNNFAVTSANQAECGDEEEDEYVVMDIGEDPSQKSQSAVKGKSQPPGSRVISTIMESAYSSSTSLASSPSGESVDQEAGLPGPAISSNLTQMHSYNTKSHNKKISLPNNNGMREVELLHRSAEMASTASPMYNPTQSSAPNQSKKGSMVTISEMQPQSSQLTCTYGFEQPSSSPHGYNCDDDGDDYGIIVPSALPRVSDGPLQDSSSTSSNSFKLNNHSKQRNSDARDAYTDEDDDYSQMIMIRKTQLEPNPSSSHSAPIENKTERIVSHTLYSPDVTPRRKQSSTASCRSMRLHQQPTEPGSVIQRKLTYGGISPSSAFYVDPSGIWLSGGKASKSSDEDLRPQKETQHCDYTVVEPNYCDKIDDTS
ncbi:PTB domain (IRS-1 type) domain-containing protein [Ditylenchus destructor]|uniref:PTB domain (IRS-1 type) domain-containing protein n=1 Tax=Ditylenchus destructor TaxID=166010 RepID=A0AAD4NFP4_9BILA|nr:PTB domain (IRS-1 type) domain-containing protein [Ditylenchus destructor]